MGDTQELIDGFEQIEKPKASPKTNDIQNQQQPMPNLADLEPVQPQKVSKMEEIQENEKETPNESDIAKMVQAENSKEFNQIIHDEPPQNNVNDKNEKEEDQNAENGDDIEEESSSSDSDSSSLSDSSSSDSDSIRSKNLKRKLSKGKLS